MAEQVAFAVPGPFLAGAVGQLTPGWPAFDGPAHAYGCAECVRDLGDAPEVVTDEGGAGAVRRCDLQRQTCLVGLYSGDASGRVADSRHVAAFVDLVLGTGAVGFNYCGPIAPCVVLEVTLTAATFGDGHGKIQVVELCGGADPVSRDEADEVATVIALEAAGVAQRVGLLEDPVACVEHVGGGVSQWVGLRDHLLSAVQLVDGRGARRVGVSGDPVRGVVSERGREDPGGADGLNYAAGGVVYVAVRGVVPVGPRGDAALSVVGEAQGRSGGVGDLGEVAFAVVAELDDGDRGLGALTGAQGESDDASAVPVAGDLDVVAPAVADGEGLSGAVAVDVDLVAVAVFYRCQPQLPALAARLGEVACPAGPRIGGRQLHVTGAHFGDAAQRDARALQGEDLGHLRSGEPVVDEDCAVLARPRRLVADVDLDALVQGRGP